MNDDDHPTDHHHHLLDNYGVSGNSYSNIKQLIVRVDVTCPITHAVDGVSLLYASTHQLLTL